MTNILEFKRPDQPTSYPREPVATIEIFDNPADSGFRWVVTGPGEPPSKEQLQSYLGDMFLSLSGYEKPVGILGRANKLIHRIFHKGPNR